MPDMTIYDFDMTGYAWLACEDVLVTLVRMDQDMIDTTWLLQRIGFIGTQSATNGAVRTAVVVRLGDGFAEVNGQPLPFSARVPGDGPEWWEVLTALVDAVSLAPYVKVSQSVTTRYEP